MAPQRDGAAEAEVPSRRKYFVRVPSERFLGSEPIA